MLGDIFAIVVKEWKMLFLKRGNRRNNGWYSILVAVGLIGVYLPVVNQGAWLTEPMNMLMWAWMPIFWTLGIITSAIAGEREAHTLETLLASRLSDTAILIGKMLSAILYGWGLMFVSSLVGAVAVNIAFIEGPFKFYQLDFYIAIQVATFLIATLFSTLGVLVSLRAPSARQAYQRLSIAMMLLFTLPSLVIFLLPDSVLQGLYLSLNSISINVPVVVTAVLGILVIVDIILFQIARLRFKRDKLILA